MRQVVTPGWYSYPPDLTAVGVTVPTVSTEPTGSHEWYGVPPQKKNETTISTTTPTPTHVATFPNLVSPIRLVQVGTVSSKYSGTSDLGPYQPRRTDPFRPAEVGTPPASTPPQTSAPRPEPGPPPPQAPGVRLPDPGRGALFQLVSGLRGPAWREAEIARLEADGWRRASEPCVMYGSVWVEKEVDE